MKRVNVYNKLEVKKTKSQIERVNSFDKLVKLVDENTNKSIMHKKAQITIKNSKVRYAF